MNKKRSDLTKRKRDRGLLILICILQLCLCLLWTGKKTYLAPDELFSYVSANNPEYIGTVPEQTWLDEEWYVDYVSAQPEHRFEYAIPYHNQDQDVHPPLFYLFLHTASSLIPDQFSYFTGTAFNILFFMICTVVLYFLGREIFESRSCGLLIAFLFGISFAGLNTVVFVRMYMLMTLLVLLHAWVYIKYMEQEKIPAKGYVFLGITLTAGVLTQYYFVIIAFFFALWYGIRFLREKDFKKTGKFVAVFAVSAAASIALYPTMLHHIFGTSRGVEAKENFSAAGGYLEKIKTMWGLLDSQLFTNLGIPVLLALLLLGGLTVVYKKSPERRWLQKTAVLLFACAGYFLVVTKIAPYQIDRYLMPIYPLLYVIAAGWAVSLLKAWIPKRAAAVLCILGFGGLSLIHMVHSSIPYTYAKDAVVTPRLELAESHEESYALYFGKEEDLYDYYEALQVLKYYQGFYHIRTLSELSEVKEDLACLENEKSVLVYISHEMDGAAVAVYLNELFPNSEFQMDDPVQTDESWDVYLLNPESN